MSGKGEGGKVTKGAYIDKVSGPPHCPPWALGLMGRILWGSGLLFRGTYREWGTGGRKKRSRKGREKAKEQQLRYWEQTGDDGGEKRRKEEKEREGREREERKRGRQGDQEAMDVTAMPCIV